MIRVERWITVLWLMIALVIAEGESEVESGDRKTYRRELDEIKIRENRKRRNIDIESTNFKSYSFKINKSAQFVLKPEQQELIKTTFDVYWKQDNVYVQAVALKGEEVTVTIQDGDGTVVANEIFYATNGLSFTALAGKTYTITAEEQGNYEKILMMQLSETVIPSNITAKRDLMAKIQAKLIVAHTKLENGLKIVNMVQMFERKISNQILKQSSVYSYFQLAEAIFIMLTAFLEVKLVINLLKTDSII